MKSLRDLIASNEDWLVARVLHHAKLRGYTTFTSTLELPWRESICGISRPILDMLDNTEDPIQVLSQPVPQDGPAMAFVLAEARLHRQRAVPLALYLGLMKYYRQAYLDLVAESVLAATDAARYRLFVDSFFDAAEIATCGAWTAPEGDDQIATLSGQLRLLINEKNKYLTIFESLDTPVFLVGEDGRVENLNHAAQALVEGTAVPGAGYYRAGRLPTPDGPVGALLARGEEGDGGELTVDTPAGPRAFRAKVQRMLDVSEKYLGTVAILSDVTDYKQAERAAEAANRAKSTFLATMSHEIRTPITGILGIGRLLQGQRLDDRGTRYVDALLSSGEILLDLVNDVLDYSKLESDQPMPEPARFAPRAMLARLALLSSAEVERKGLAFRLEIAPEVPQEVLGDRAKIQRILLNLVGNAVKFTQRGSIVLAVAPDGDGLRFSITDTGPGIAEADRARLFAPFVQYVMPGMRLPSGTGLGLAICKRLAEALGAEIGVESREGEGSRFHLRCPGLAIPAPPAPPESEPEAAPAPRQPAPLRVLLVEDNAVNALVLEGFLSRDGHDVTTADSGEDALAALAARPFDLVLMDIRMHGMSGIEAIRQIRGNADPAIAKVPIVALTADFARANEPELLAHGADAVLEKPCSPEDLARAMARVVPAPGDRIAFSRDEPVIDDAALRAHREAVGPVQVDQIVGAFLEEAPQQEAAVRAAGAAGDAAALWDLAHVLRSSAGIVGLRRLASLAAHVCTQSDPAGQIALAAALAEEIERGTAALRALAGSGRKG